jgi:hypothetical protein
MNQKLLKTSSRPAQKLAVVAAIIVSLLTTAATAQPAPNNSKAQREAMQKLAFLEGQWSGPVTIVRGPGEPLHLTQTENIHFKLGGLVLLVEGKSTAADGTVQFEALATIAYDSDTNGYRIRAYHDGNYLDTELSVLPDSFSWGYTSGPAKIRNAMRLTAKGEWQETTTVAIGSNPARTSVDMLLTRKP